MILKIMIYDGRKIISQNDTESRYETVFEKKTNRYDLEELETYIKNVGLTLYNKDYYQPHYEYVESFVGIYEHGDINDNELQYVILVSPEVKE